MDSNSDQCHSAQHESDLKATCLFLQIKNHNRSERCQLVIKQSKKFQFRTGQRKKSLVLKVKDH